MKVSNTTALHLRCIEADLREYLIEPMAYSSEYFEDIHVLLLEVMHNLGVEPTENGEEENIDIDLDGGLSATNEQGESEC
jgi:hypothetical protein